jgi:hypothetical protein
MTRSLFLLLLFSSFIPDRASAWISSTTSLSSSPLPAPVVVGRKRSRTNHHHRRQHQYFHEKRRILLRFTIVTRSSFLLQQSSRDHDDDDDDDGTIDVEEEEFYHPDFDDDDANNANNDTDDDDDDDDDDNDTDTDLKIKRRTKTTTTNKDEELSKAWDDAVINNKEEGNVSRDLEEGEEEGMISNLSVLQQRLQQQIREQKKKGRPQKPQQQQQPNTKRVQLDDDTLTEFQKWGKDLDDMKQQQQQQQQQKQQMKQNDNIDIHEGEGKLQSDVYIDTLQRTQEKLLEITTTTANGGMVSSDISDMQKKLAEIQQQQTMKLQQEAQHQRDDDDDDDDGFDIDKGEDEETYKAKTLDDNTLVEWEELENQLKSEQDEERRILLRSRNGNNDEAAMMTALFSEEEDNDDNEMNNNNNNNSYNISPRLDDILPQSEEDELLDEAAILDRISSSTTENKKVVTESEYEVTGDGVFLSAEAYQQACDNANTDGSLNFGKTNTSDGSSSSSSNNKNKRFLSPSVLEALKAKPMAPYGKEEEEEEVSGPEKKKKKKKKVITLEDLSQQVTRSRRLVEDNPEAQEELHRRLMAEEPTFENDESDLFKEVLTNPQKASEFWNQEYIEKQNEESSALEKLLDQRMRQLEELEEQKKKSRNKNVNNTRKVSADAQKQQQKIIDRDIYFASSKKEKDERNKIIESDRLERSKNIAKFYRDTEDDSDWGGFVTKEDRNIIKNENDFKNNNDNDNDDDNDDDNNDDDEHQVENVLEENQKTKEDSEWVLVEDPTSEEDPFYWNEVSGEMRWEPPSES